MANNQETHERSMQHLIYMQMHELKSRFRDFVPGDPLTRAYASESDATADYHARMARLKAEYQRWCDLEDKKIAEDQAMASILAAKEA